MGERGGEVAELTADLHTEQCRVRGVDANLREAVLRVDQAEGREKILVDVLKDADRTCAACWCNSASPCGGWEMLSFF